MKKLITLVIMWSLIAGEIVLWKTDPQPLGHVEIFKDSKPVLVVPKRFEMKPVRERSHGNRRERRKRR